MVMAIMVLENPSGERMLLMATGKLSTMAGVDLLVEQLSADL